MIRLERATLAHAGAVCHDLREADRNEWVGATGEPAGPLIHRAVQECPVCWAMVDAESGAVLCLYGASGSDRPTVGVAWLVATRHADAMSWRIVRRVFKPAMATLDEHFDTLVAVADARNTLHHQWLVWAGFTLSGVSQVGPLGLKFLTFTRSAPACASP